jgi:hypothetical protein
MEATLDAKLVHALNRVKKLQGDRHAESIQDSLESVTRSDNTILVLSFYYV